MDTQNKTLPNIVRDIVFFYVKFYYDKYLKENNISNMTDTDINNFIHIHYTNKETEIRNYIRKSLKKNLGNNYKPISVENILMEIFNDPEMAFERIKIEIIDYQNNKLASN